MQTVRDKIRAFQEWKEEQEKNAAGEDCEDEGFNDGDEGVGEAVKGAGEEINEGFKDEMSKETKWMQQIHKGEGADLDPFKLASSSFLEELKEREDSHLSSEVPFSLSNQEKYSTFQTKTRYLEFVTRRDKQVLKGLVAPLAKEEAGGASVLGILVDHLTEMLYLSLKKSLLLSRGFKPLLEARSRVLYFTFFASFLTFLLRSYQGEGRKALKLYALPPTLRKCLRELEGLAALKLRGEQEGEDGGGGERETARLHGIRKSLSLKLNKHKLKNFDLEALSDEEDGEGEEDD
ncbi:hypothetical protein VE02_10019, partial [Pseudogymnoascus sp. 03VT05]